MTNDVKFRHAGSVQNQKRFHAKRRSAHRDRDALRSPRRGAALPDPARHHRQRQDVHRRQCHPALPAPHADHRAEQDPGGAAVRRDAGHLPGKCRPLLRQLLRLLPARSVHPEHGHLHREGRDHQRPDRSDAPRSNARAPVAARRDHRGKRELYLRHRFGGDVRGSSDRDRQGRGAQTRQPAAEARRHPVRAKRRSTSTAALSGCAAT